MIQTRHGEATPHMLITFADGTMELVLILEDEQRMSTPKNGLGYLKKEESKERNNPMEE
jgi:hypothetical protein